ncbi:MAG: RuBisCO large subunit C-terminal-like domain-containing protein [Spirochaetia bacterium]|nr:RuBisCO large subunit C-terminal-like domain-containing protein [Spirochaetia bacterium]
MIENRFTVTYQITGNEKSSHEAAKIICYEQTVELNEDVLKDETIRENVVGKIEIFREIKNEIFEAVISYDEETTAYELPQLLNVMFGNTSIKPNVRLFDFSLSDGLRKKFRGPKFGITGIRKLLNVYDNPLLCSALKPMGKSAEELANLTFQLAKGGVDIIKDDHGLSNQSFCSFEERVSACASAVKKANEETGRNSIYVPHITGRYDDVMKRAAFAKEKGALGYLISPGLCSFDTMLAVSENDKLNLPVISHPAFLGGMSHNNENGISHKILYGKLQRLSGADSSIFPNYGGRFSFSKEECENIKNGCLHEMNDYLSIFPMPGGGMSEERLPDMLKLYGNDVIFLIGGALFQDENNIEKTCRRFLNTMGR